MTRSVVVAHNPVGEADDPSTSDVLAQVEMVEGALASLGIEKGKPFLATHPDRTCPTDEPTVLPDCGALCKMLEHATGRGPDAVLGKPNPRMLRGVMRRHDLRPEQLAGGQHQPA